MKALNKEITAAMLAEIRKHCHGTIAAIKKEEVLRLRLYYVTNANGFIAERFAFKTPSGEKRFSGRTDVAAIKHAIKNGYEVIWFVNESTFNKFLKELT